MRPLIFFSLLLIIVVVYLVAYSLYLKKKYDTVTIMNSESLIQIDSLKTENKLLSSQMAYLFRFYDSTNKKIPQSEGYAFIADNIIQDSTKK